MLGDAGPHGSTPSDKLSNKAPARASVQDKRDEHESSSNLSAGSRVAVPESSSSCGTSPPGTPPEAGGSFSSVRTTESKMDEVYERQTRVQQVAQAQVHDGRPFV